MTVFYNFYLTSVGQCLSVCRQNSLEHYRRMFFKFAERVEDTDQLSVD